MKNWKKPAVMTLKAKELSAYIRAAARSRQCPFGYFR